MITPSKAAIRKERARREAAAQRERWALDPVAFAREALGVDLWDAQIAVVRSVAAGRKTSWRASQKVGKSTTKAVLALWRAYCFDRALVVMTSGNRDQVKLVLWREVRRLYSGALVPLGGTLHLDPATGLTYPDGRLVVGLTAADPERMGGYSYDPLFLIDEASGIDDEILTAALGNLAGGGGILLGGNPTKTTGFFARTHRDKISGWDLHHTSALDSPNIRAGRIVVKGLAEPDFPQSMADDFGEASAAYQVRVLGEYAEEGTDQVITLALVSMATGNYDDTPSGLLPGDLFVGVDPARFGDDETGIQGVIGSRALAAVQHRKLDNVEVAAKVVEYVDAHRPPGACVTIRVDTGGLGGGVYDHLVRHYESGSKVEIVSVNASSASAFPAKFVNARAQLWFGLRRWMERGGTLPEDKRRDQELLAAKYKHDGKLRIQILSKDEMKKVLRRSPDRADALALAVFHEHPMQEGESQGATTPLVQPPRVPKPWEGTPHPALALDPDQPLSLIHI